MLRNTLTALVIAFAGTPCWTQDGGGTAQNGTVELAYWVHGPADGMPLVVINGQGAASRPGGDGLTAALMDQGFRVITFDNRDSGQSTIMGEAGEPIYDLSDMADDTIAVLDATGTDRAHVLGHSLGGMIAQVLAADHPDRVLSLISVSSTSGDPDLPFGPALAALSAAPAEPTAPVADQQARVYRLFEGSAYRMTDAEVRDRVAVDMAVQDPDAAARQGAAVAATGDRRALLRGITLPALVIHGGADPWFPVSHAESVADALGGARLKVIDGMGHILADPAAGAVATHVADFVRDE